MKRSGANVITLFCLLLPAMSLAQAPTDTDGQTVVARFEISKEAFQDVKNSADLVTAVREHLTLDLTMPLDEPISISLRGWAGAQGGEGPPYNFVLSSLGVRYEGGHPLVDFPYALAVRNSHGDVSSPDTKGWVEIDAEDWDEDAAWSSLVTALDVGLPQSSNGFESPLNGQHIGLRVKGVHVREFTLAAEDPGWGDYGFCCLEDFQGPVFQLQPDTWFQSATEEGGVADELVQHRNILVIELEPEPIATEDTGD